MAKQTVVTDEIPGVKRESTAAPPVDKPPHTSLEDAMEIIEVYAREGAHFTNKQLDMFIEIIIKRSLPPDEIPWFREVARDNRVPLWMMLMCQWRRAQESGSAYQLFMDPGWEKVAAEE